MPDWKGQSLFLSCEPRTTESKKARIVRGNILIWFNGKSNQKTQKGTVRMVPQMYANRIKGMYNKGIKISDISRQLGHSRNTVVRYVNGAESGYHRQNEPAKPVAEIIRPILEIWLEEDKVAPHKQRRTITKIYSDLRWQYRYEGSYSTVKRVVLEIRGSSKEVFIPRAHQPGEYGEFDFGELYLEINGTRHLVYLHAYQLPYSNDIFAYISRRQSQEEMFYSHRLAFVHFEGIPKKMRYDNLKQAVTKVLKGREREENTGFRTFRDQFGFESEFCEPCKGNQKGDVEGCVGYVRRNFFSPVPKLKDWTELDSLNKILSDWCVKQRDIRRHPDNVSVGQIFLQEQSCLNFLPAQLPEVGKRSLVKANHYSLASVDKAFYSVPTKFAYQLLDVLITAREVIFFHKHTEIARHSRTFEVGKQAFNILHYLPLFQRKPYALINSKPIQELPPIFAHFFKKAQIKGFGTVQDCLAVLELIKEHPVADIAVAIELAMSYETYYAEGVKNLLVQLKTAQPQFQKLTFHKTELQAAKVQAIDLKRYDELSKQKVI